MVHKLGNYLRTNKNIFTDTTSQYHLSFGHLTWLKHLKDPLLVPFYIKFLIIVSLVKIEF